MPTSSGKKKRSDRAKSKRSVQDANVPGVREVRRSIKRISEAYGGGIAGNQLATDICSNPKLLRKVERAIQHRHEAVIGRIDEDGIYTRGEHTWKVPLGVRLCMERPLIWGQIVQRNPWAVVWHSPTTGNRMRKFFPSAVSAIDFIATGAQYVDRKAAVVSRPVGYDIPAPLRGKLPKPWKWCPYCMNARKFKRRKSGGEFYATVKKWNEDKRKYEWVERKLAIFVCPVCRCTNQDTHFRRSNQPWEVRRIKRGVRRVRRKR